MQLIALGDRVFVIENDSLEKTSTGIYLVGEDARDHRIGTVVTAGKDSKVNPHLNKGDTVYYPKFAGQRVNVSGQEYVVLRFDEVLAVERV